MVLHQPRKGTQVHATICPQILIVYSYDPLAQLGKKGTIPQRCRPYSCHLLVLAQLSVELSTPLLPQIDQEHKLISTANEGMTIDTGYRATTKNGGGGGGGANDKPNKKTKW
jgi:hypothetical protein